MHSRRPLSFSRFRYDFDFKEYAFWTFSGMNVARLNMSHGDHASHKAIVDLIKEYNETRGGNIAVMLDTKVHKSSFLVIEYHL